MSLKKSDPFGEGNFVYKVDRPIAAVVDQPGKLDIVLGKADAFRPLDEIAQVFPRIKSFTPFL